MRTRETLLFLGVWFYAGIALMLVGAYGYATWEPAELSGVFQSPFSGTAAKYINGFMFFLGAIYTLIGWNKARGWTR